MGSIAKNQHIAFPRTGSVRQYQQALTPHSMPRHHALILCLPWRYLRSLSLSLALSRSLALTFSLCLSPSLSLSHTHSLFVSSSYSVSVSLCAPSLWLSIQTHVNCTSLLQFKIFTSCSISRARALCSLSLTLSALCVSQSLSLSLSLSLSFTKINKADPVSGLALTLSLTRALSREHQHKCTLNPLSF